MKPPRRPAAPGLCSFLALLLLLPALPGCGGRHAASRPASVLSAQDLALLDRYENIRAALAADDLRATKRAGTALHAFLSPLPKADPALLADADTIGNAVALDRARQAFETLSASVVKLVDGVENYYIFETPIPAGAEWVQKTAEPDNPYTGKAMHDLGTRRK